MAAAERIEHPESTTIPQRELRNNVSEVLRRAESGERLTITVNGRPVAELGPVPVKPAARKKGTMEGLRRIQRRAAKDPSFAEDVMRMREEDRENAVEIWPELKKRQQRET